MPASPTKLTTITLRLPYPPSVNTYWRHVLAKKGRAVMTYIAEKGKHYRASVQGHIWQEYGMDFAMLTSRLAVSIECIMPDRRKRDIDNVPKAVLDALAFAGVYEDDSQIDQLVVTRLHVEPPGCVDVTIQELTLADFEKGGA